jgi:nifR3 family TIM-barrel protein
MIDLNMGCPVAKVVRDGAGAALMRTPDLAARIVEASVAVARTANLPVTVKFRKGWNESQVNAPGFARLCETAGAAALTIHGRTCSQMYGGRADQAIIAAVKQAVDIPVFGNGDVRSAGDAARMIQDTHVDGVMVGRAAQGNPWIFRQLLLDEPDAAGGPSPDERAAVFEEHLRGLCALLGETVAVREMRKHLAWYLHGIPGAAAMKNRGMAAVRSDEMMAVWEDWLIHCSKSCENS